MQFRRLAFSLAPLVLVTSSLYALNPTAVASDDDLDIATATIQEPIQSATDAIEAQIANDANWTSHYGGAEISVPNKRVTFY